MELIIMLIVGVVAVIGFFMSFVTVQQSERAVIERFGKYNKFLEPGLHFKIPLIDECTKVDITEMISNVGGQEIITKDKLNAMVDAQVYYKIKEDEASIKNCLYKVSNCQSQIVSLARTTLRNIIGTMNLTEANSGRDAINNALKNQLTKETKNWGIEIVRTELKEINPPKDVQDSMNKVVKAENEKVAAVDLATAKETIADGEKRAEIKRAEGDAQAVKIRAEAQAESIELVNTAAEKFFKGNAQKLKQMEVTQACLQNNTKVVITEKGISPSVILGNLIGAEKNGGD